MNEVLYYLATGVLSFCVTFAFTKLLIPRLKRFGMVGKDENKANAPEVAEMGGLAIVAGLTAGILLAVTFNSFLGFQFNLVNVLAAMITIHAIAFIGITDDLLDIPQWLKAILPLFAAAPLVAVKAASSTAIFVPFLGHIDFGLAYILILIPIGIAVSSNLSNMLAGYNGMEAGMAAVIFAAVGILALHDNAAEMAVIAFPMLAALLAFLFFNWYPARIFPGDVGNLTFGVVLASAVIIGNLESAGALLMIPYVIDFFIKAANRFPHTYQDVKNGKIYPKEGKVKGFAHLVMKLANGISERNLALVFIGIEAIVAVGVLAVYLTR